MDTTTKLMVTEVHSFRNAWICLILALVVSWTIWIPSLLFVPENIQTPFLLIGGFGPFIAAIITSWRFTGKDSLKDWLKITFHLRINWRWYVLGGIILPFGMAILHHMIYLLFGGESAFTWNTNWLIYPLAVIVTALLGGGMEEPGWRAYVTPRLINRIHPIFGSTVVGLFWVIWHLPLYFMQNWSGADQPLTLFIIYAIALSIIMTWLYYKSSGSVLPVVLLHGATNVVFRYVPRETELWGTMDFDFNVLKATAYWIFALVIIIVTRGNLEIKKQH